jgi:hypothetical protein
VKIVDLQVEPGVNDAQTKQEKLRPKKKPPIPDDGIGQQPQNAAHPCFRQLFHHQPTDTRKPFCINSKQLNANPLFRQCRKASKIKNLELTRPDKRSNPARGFRMVHYSVFVYSLSSVQFLCFIIHPRVSLICG